MTDSCACVHADSHICRSCGHAFVEGERKYVTDAAHGMVGICESCATCQQCHEVVEDEDYVCACGRESVA